MADQEREDESHRPHGWTDTQASDRSEADSATTRKLVFWMLGVGGVIVSSIVVGLGTANFKQHAELDAKVAQYQELVGRLSERELVNSAAQASQIAVNTERLMEIYKRLDRLEAEQRMLAEGVRRLK